MLTYKVDRTFKVNDPWFIIMTQKLTSIKKLIIDHRQKKAIVTDKAYKFMTQLLIDGAMPNTLISEFGKVDFLSIIDYIDEYLPLNGRTKGVVKWLRAVFNENTGMHYNDLSTILKIRFGILIAHLFWQRQLQQAFETMPLLIGPRSAYGYEYRYWGRYDYYYAINYQTPTFIFRKGKFENGPERQIPYLEAISIMRVLQSIQTEIILDYMGKLNSILTANIAKLPLADMLIEAKKANQAAIIMSRQLDQTQDISKEIQNLIVDVSINMTQLESVSAKIDHDTTQNLDSGRKDLKNTLIANRLNMDGKNGSTIDYIVQNCKMISITMMEQGKWIAKANKTTLKKKVSAVVMINSLVSGFFIGITTGHLTKKLVNNRNNNIKSQEMIAKQLKIERDAQQIKDNQNEFGI